MIRRVCVIGLGYVGLPTAATLATRGLDVIGADLSAERVAIINSGTSPIDEPDLDALVSGAVASGHLCARAEPVPADAFVIAVGTPIRDDHAPDLSQLYSATDSLAPVLRPGNLIVLESTSPVGTTEAMCGQLAVARPDLSFPHSEDKSKTVHVAYCPERVLPGQILHELVGGDRVIGGITPACANAAAKLYQVFVDGACHLTTARTAELVKLAENAYRDLNIAFANEMVQVCEAMNIDPWQMIRLANHHPRVNILQPGPGVGGHCIPIDPWFIVHSRPDATPLIRTARQINDAKPGRIASQAIAACTHIENPVIACLGLAYKADVGDMRESPAIAVVRQLQTSFPGEILVVEPHIPCLPTELASQEGIKLVDLTAALDTAQVMVLLTDHREFCSVDPQRLSGKKVIDTRGAWRKVTC